MDVARGTARWRDWSAWDLGAIAGRMRLEGAGAVSLLQVSRVETSVHAVGMTCCMYGRFTVENELGRACWARHRACEGPSKRLEWASQNGLDLVLKLGLGLSLSLGPGAQQK